MTDLNVILIGTSCVGWAVALGAGTVAVVSANEADAARKLRDRIMEQREADLIGSEAAKRQMRALTAEVAHLKVELAKWRPARGAKGHFLKPEAGAQTTG